MNVLILAIALFVFLEILNVIILYFKPDSTLGNGIGVFKAWDKSKLDEDVHNLVKYLVYWVAGSKIIFIALLIIVIFTGTRTTQLLSVGVLILSIITFFWRLYPIIRHKDKNDKLHQKGYSRTLGLMIGSFIIVFAVALVISLLEIW